MNNHLLARFGLKYNPFTPDIPTEALHGSLNSKNLHGVLNILSFVKEVLH